jgi:cytidine deaminase
MAIDGAVRERLLLAARKAALSAYCPHSRFHVGAAVWADGRVFTGCNIENASYGLTICAERVAIFTAVAAGCLHLEALAVTCPDAPFNSPRESRMPCGACRQVMAEFGGRDLVVLVDGIGELRLADLLPHPFLLSRPNPKV